MHLHVAETTHYILPDDVLGCQVRKSCRIGAVVGAVPARSVSDPTMPLEALPSVSLRIEPSPTRATVEAQARTVRPLSLAGVSRLVSKARSERPGDGESSGLRTAEGITVRCTLSPTRAE